MRFELEVWFFEPIDPGAWNKFPTRISYLAHVREGIRCGPGASRVHEIDKRALLRREADALVPHLCISGRTNRELINRGLIGNRLISDEISDDQLVIAVRIVGDDLHSGTVLIYPAVGMQQGGSCSGTAQRQDNVVLQQGPETRLVSIRQILTDLSNSI